MSELINAIEWEQPIFPIVADQEWEREVKRVTGSVGDVYRRITPNLWIRQGAINLEKYQPTQLTHKLVDIISLVSAQENACRYCYGAVRAQMKLLGHSESYISKLEREVQMAELNEKERLFVAFCRSLSRSSPRPSAHDRQALLDQGFSEKAVAETVFLIAMNCLVNRVATFVASAPELGYEKLANSKASYLFRTIGPVLRPLREKKLRKAAAASIVQQKNWQSSTFGPILETLRDLPAAELLGNFLEGCFASPVLPQRTKTLIFAVVARTLDCDICQREMGRQLEENGMSSKDVDTCLTTLDMPDLEPYETKILDWARNTVHYQPGPIQKRTRLLVQEIGEEKALEAVGVASLANSVVRIAMLLT